MTWHFETPKDPKERSRRKLSFCQSIDFGCLWPLPLWQVHTKLHMDTAVPSSRLLRICWHRGGFIWLDNDGEIIATTKVWHARLIRQSWTPLLKLSTMLRHQPIPDQWGAGNA